MADQIWANNTDIGFGAQISNDVVVGTNDFFAIGRAVNIPRTGVSYLNLNDGIHVPIETPQKLYLASTDVGDEGIPVLVQGLDENYLETSRVILASNSAPTDMGIWGAIHGMSVVGPQACIGNITASTLSTVPILGDTSIQSVIVPQDQTSYNSYFLVPRGRIAYAYEFIFTDYRTSGGTAGSAEFFLETRQKDKGDGMVTPWTRRAYAGLQISGSSGFIFDTKTPFRIPELSELRIGVDSSVNNISASVVVQLILRDI